MINLLTGNHVPYMYTYICIHTHTHTHKHETFRQITGKTHLEKNMDLFS